LLDSLLQEMVVGCLVDDGGDGRVQDYPEIHSSEECMADPPP